MPKDEIVRIAGRSIGRNEPPFVIAEMSGNHNQSLEQALKLATLAADAGADALKLQTYTPETITLDVHEGDFFISDEKNPWKGTSLHRLYQQAHTPWEWHEPIMRLARDRGLICFSTPFDETAVDFLESLDVPAYKIASFENNHLPLIRRVARTGKPLIISTGMATLAELDEAVAAARAEGCTQLVLLKCTSTYPATPEDSNILTIPHLRSLFRCEVGLSDHTHGIGVAAAAVAHGATVIEKHFTERRSDGGVDSVFSLEPAEFTSLTTEVRRAWQALGEISYGPTKAERGSLVFRRSLYVAQDMEAGEEFNRRNLRIVRPGHGLHPRHYEQLLGRKVARSLKKGTPVDWSMIG